MAFSRFYSIHLRTLVIAISVPIFVVAWWWASFVGPWPALAPTEAVAGKRIVIDAGHGGVDPGAVGLSGALEKDVVLAIALKLKSLFNRAAMYTTMIRDDDRDLGEGTGTLREQKRTDLKRRVEIANQRAADIYLSLHANSFPSPRWSGAQTFFYPGKSEDQALATAIQSELIRVAPENTRTARPGEYYVLQGTQMPAVVIEVGFLSNPREEELLRDPEYQSELAAAIFRGVVLYLVQQASRDAVPRDTSVLGSPDGAADGSFRGRPWIFEAIPPGADEFLVYFDSPANTVDGLAASIGTFPPEIARGSQIDKMRYAVDVLVQGPPTGSALLPTAPPGTRVRALDFTGGTVRVDFSSDVYLRFWGGGRSEELLVESVVRTLGQFPDVERVSIQVEGRSEGTLAGHVDISRPFEVRRTERP